jgi:hypothetical protein
VWRLLRRTDQRHLASLNGLTWKRAGLFTQLVVDQMCSCQAAPTGPTSLRLRVLSYARGSKRDSCSKPPPMVTAHWMLFGVISSIIFSCINPWSFTHTCRTQLSVSAINNPGSDPQKLPIEGQDEKSCPVSRDSDGWLMRLPNRCICDVS